MKKSTNASVTIRATRKERAALWAIACWFPENIVSSQLKQQLYPGYMVARLAKEYDDAIQSRIVELGAYFESKKRDGQDD